MILKKSEQAALRRRDVGQFARDIQRPDISVVSLAHALMLFLPNLMAY